MKIDTSNVILGGRHHFESEYQAETSSRSSFRSILGGAAEAQALDALVPTLSVAKKDRVRLMFEQLIAEMLALISGLHAAKLTNMTEVVAQPGEEVSGKAVQGPPGGRELIWQRTFSERIREHERSEFSASGEVRTADGQVIDFKLDLVMSRDFQCERKLVEQGKVVLRDPLVINFDGKAAELGSLRFAFDLDSDGKSESLHALTGNSGFLAFDRNADGRINDGRELFGARSGDGFADLAASSDAGFKAVAVAASGTICSSNKGNDKSHGANLAWVLRLQHRRQKVAEHIAQQANQLHFAWFRLRIDLMTKAASGQSTTDGR